MAVTKTQKRVFYSHIATEGVGEVWFAQGQGGIWRIEFGRDRERFLADLARDGVEAVADERSTAITRKALKEYFAGKRREFPIAIDWSRLDGFTRKALQVCARIPYGKTLSYGEVAARAGSPGGARAVGQAMAKNPFPIIVPCHRVLASGGKIGGFSGGLHFKRSLLDLEGARAKPNRAR